MVLRGVGESGDDIGADSLQSTASEKRKDNAEARRTQRFAEKKKEERVHTEGTEEEHRVHRGKKEERKEQKRTEKKAA